MSAATRRQRFVEAYLGEAAGNAAEAARLAGYSVHTARSAGSRLLTLANVKADIADRQKALAEQSGYSAERVIQRLASIADAPVALKDIRASDQVKALELLGKAHGLFQEKERADSRITVNIGFLTPPDHAPKAIGHGRSQARRELTSPNMASLESLDVARSSPI